MLTKGLATSLLLLSVAACGEIEPEDAAPENVAASTDAITGAIAPGTLLTTTSRLNLRDAPSQRATIRSTIPSRVRVTAIGGAATNGYYEISYDGETGWAYGAYLVPEAGSSPSAPSSSHVHSGVTLLWQGDWAFLTRCDSYSRARGRVVFFCDETPSRSFVDDGAWIAVPRAYFSRDLCNRQARVCKGTRCIDAKVVEKSETTGRWEGSTAVLEALGVDTGFSGCSSSFGTATGVSVTLF